MYVNNRRRQKDKVSERYLSEEYKMALDIIGDANRRVLKDAQRIKHMDNATCMNKLVEYSLEGARRYCGEQETEEEV